MLEYDLEIFCIIKYKKLVIYFQKNLQIPKKDIYKKHIYKKDIEIEVQVYTMNNIYTEIYIYRTYINMKGIYI